MDPRAVIAATLENMNRIYRDIGQIVQIIEEKMRNEGFQAIGDAAVTWEVSTAYHSPSSWLYRWFARIFWDDEHPTKAVGYCLHLGNYARRDEETLIQMGVSFPFVNVSLLEGFEKAVNTFKRRSDLYNCLWGAGWYEGREKVTNQAIVESRVTYGEVAALATTYFVDMLALVDDLTIGRLVVEPMVKMFQGDKAVASTLPVIRLP